MTLCDTLLTIRVSKHTIPVLEQTLEDSSQLAVRWTIVLIFALARLAYRLRARPPPRWLRGGDDYKAPVALDVTALFASPGSAAKIFLFFVLFLVVRGAPALLLYRNVLDWNERRALALLSSTQLPLVVATMALGTSSGDMRASTSAALTGAAPRVPHARTANRETGSRPPDDGGRVGMPALFRAR